MYVISETLTVGLGKDKYIIYETKQRNMKQEENKNEQYWTHE